MTIQSDRAEPREATTQKGRAQPKTVTIHPTCALAFDDPILGLDVASSGIGWAVLTGKTHVGGLIQFRGELGEQLAEYRTWVRDMVRHHRPAVIACEDAFIRQGAAAINLLNYQGVTRESLDSYIGLLMFIPHGTWKKAVCGRGNISTKEKAAGVIQRIIEAQGFTTDSLDEADAVALALCARGQIMSHASS